MTLIVAVNNVIYVDSCQAIGDATHSVSKIIKCKFGVYAAAGNADVASKLIAFLEAKDNMFEPIDWDDADGTCVYMRTEDGQAYFIALGEKPAIFAKLTTPTRLGLQSMAGSGWKFFHSYFLEHEDLERAFALTAKFCRDVSLPIEKF